MRKYLYILLFLLIPCVVFGQAQVDTLIASQSGTTNGTDAVYMTARSDATPGGSGATFQVGQHTTFQVSRALATFRLSTSGITVEPDSVIIWLYLETDWSTTDFNYAVYAYPNFYILTDADYLGFEGYNAGGAHTPDIMSVKLNSSTVSATWNKLKFTSNGIDSVFAHLSDSIQVILLSDEDISASQPTTIERLDFFDRSDSDKEPRMIIYSNPPTLTNFTITDSSAFTATVEMDTSVAGGGNFDPVKIVQENTGDTLQVFTGGVITGIITELTPDSTHWLKAVGFQSGVATAVSNLDTVTTLTAPIIFTITDSNSIGFTWIADTTGAQDSLKLVQMFPTPIDTISRGIDTTGIETSLLSGTQYIFKIVGYLSGDSAVSNLDTVTTLKTITLSLTDSSAISATFLADTAGTFDSLGVKVWEPDDSLKLFLAYEDSLIDLSGTGNTGINAGGTYTASGVDFKAMRFDGTDDYVNIDTMRIPLVGNTTGTWTTWVRPDSAVAPATEAIISFSWGTNNNELLEVLKLADGTLSAQATVGGVQKWKLVTDNPAFTDDSVYVHVAISHNGIEPTLYIDKIAVAQTFSTDVDRTIWILDYAGALDNVRIGTRFTGGAETLWFRGMMDETRIYSRALSQIEIQAIYESTSFDNQNYALPAGIQGDYKFNGNVSDSSGYGYDGSATAITYEAGRSGVALDSAGVFNGTTSLVEIDAVLTPLASTTAGTWSAWVKLDTTVATQNIISFSETGGNEFIRLLYNSKKLSAALRNGGANQWNVVTDNVVFAYNTLAHVTLVQNGTSPILYFNGVAIAVTASGADETQWFATAGMASLNGGDIGTVFVGSLIQFAKGSIQDVKIFDSALTASEVYSLYTFGMVVDSLSSDTEYNMRLIGFEGATVTTYSNPDTVTTLIPVIETYAVSNPGVTTFDWSADTTLYGATLDKVEIIQASDSTILGTFGGVISGTIYNLIEDKQYITRARGYFSTLDTIYTNLDTTATRTSIDFGFGTGIIAGGKDFGRRKQGFNKIKD